MNAVGIDVSKGKSMVAIMRPFGEIVSTPFEIKHTSSDINSLVKLIKSIEGESRIVMEHTGRYYEVLAHQLSEANLFVSAINRQAPTKLRLIIPISITKTHIPVSTVKGLPGGRIIISRIGCREIRNKINQIPIHADRSFIVDRFQGYR